MRKIRIGSGAGYAEDRLEPAIDLMKHGNIDYIIFECLAERTIALAQQRKLKDPSKGYNQLLEYRMEKILPLCVEKGIKVITNMGAANPVAAAKVIKEMALKLGLSSLKIAAVTGDDVYDQIEKYADRIIVETGQPLQEINTSIISANAYIGVKGVIMALEQGADIIVTGRLADPSLVVGPLVYEFGWSEDELLGKGTLAGHLLECGAQVTGGYFADPGYKEVPNLSNVGFPIAEIDEYGSITITKLEDAGGIVSPATVKEQILYEIHDPENYFTPDVVADFSNVEVIEVEANKVLVTGATGKKKTGLYKTSVGYKDGYIVEAEISYGGSGAINRAQLAGDIVAKRLDMLNIPHEEIRFDYIGVNSLYYQSLENQAPLSEVRLRVAARTKLREEATKIGNEVEALYTNGPAGGGGIRVNIKEIVSIASILIPEQDVSIDLVIEEV